MLSIALKYPIADIDSLNERLINWNYIKSLAVAIVFKKKKSTSWIFPFQNWYKAYDINRERVIMVTVPSLIAKSGLFLNLEKWMVSHGELL